MLDGPDDFTAGVELLPRTADTKTGLTIDGKLVRNEDALRTSLQRWIATRRAEAGTCSLCFGDLAKRGLRRACGRSSGCAQDICESCRRGWYGLSARGRLINVAALPSRVRSIDDSRSPAPCPGPPTGCATYLGNLRAAVEQSGS